MEVVIQTSLQLLFSYPHYGSEELVQRYITIKFINFFLRYAEEHQRVMQLGKSDMFACLIQVIALSQLRTT